MKNETLRDYLNYLLIKGYHRKTALTKYQNVKEFLDFTKKKITEISSQDIINYHHYLKQRPNKITGKSITIKTVHHHIRTIEMYFIFLQEMELLLQNPFPDLRLPKNHTQDFEREIVTQSEIKKLYTIANTQEKIILHLAYGCGLRVSELVAIKKEDIYLKEQILIVPKGKNNKRRIIPLTQKITQDLEDYLALQSSNNQLFILNTKGEKMQEWTYNYILKKLLKRIKIEQERIPKISIHSLRHSIATHLLEKGMELEKVRDFLGHSQLETTEIYTHISMKQLINLNNNDP